MTRIVSLWLPRWSTDRLYRQEKTGGSASAPPPDAPLVLKGTDGRRRIVFALNAAAETAGIRKAMPLAKAQTLVEGLIVRDADPDADAEGLEKLAQWALRRFSPLVAVDPPDGLVMDITGAAHLHGGEQGLLNTLVEALTDKGIAARTAAAGSWGAAHAVARSLCMATSIVPPDGTMKAISPLPVSALRLPPGIVHSLYSLGLESIGDLIAQPRAPLARRFGLETLRRLDQALGQVAQPFAPVHLPDVPQVERGFFEPIGAPETLARYTGILTENLCRVLEDKGLGARQLDLLFTRVDNRIEAIRIGLARPVRDKKRLTRLLCDKLEAVDPGFGIERMRLTASEVEPLLPVQGHMQEDAGSDLSALIDILANRIGADHIYRPMPVESDVPERSVQHVSALSSEAKPWPKTGWPRPVRLLQRPEALKPLARLPDHPPSHLVWRGQRYRVTAADGPERIYGEWWRRDAEMAAVRDYFRVELETGERLWIYRSGDGENPATGSSQWYLHGFFA